MELTRPFDALALRVKGVSRGRSEGSGRKGYQASEGRVNARFAKLRHAPSRAFHARDWRVCRAKPPASLRTSRTGCGRKDQFDRGSIKQTFEPIGDQTRTTEMAEEPPVVVAQTATDGPGHAAALEQKTTIDSMCSQSIRRPPR
jgi:hypothetical protein